MNYIPLYFGAVFAGVMHNFSFGAETFYVNIGDLRAVANTGTPETADARQLLALRQPARDGVPYSQLCLAEFLILKYGDVGAKLAPGYLQMAIDGGTSLDLFNDNQALAKLGPPNGGSYLIPLSDLWTSASAEDAQAKEFWRLRLGATRGVPIDQIGCAIYLMKNHGEIGAKLAPGYLQAAIDSGIFMPFPKREHVAALAEVGYAEASELLTLLDRPDQDSVEIARLYLEFFAGDTVFHATGPEFIIRLAVAGDRNAQFEYATSLVNGEDGEWGTSDYPIQEWIQNAIDDGRPSAKGLLEKFNERVSRIRLHNAAIDGDHDAQFEIVTNLLNGRYGPGYAGLYDWVIRKWIQNAIDDNKPSAQDLLVKYDERQGLATPDE